MSTYLRLFARDCVYLVVRNVNARGATRAQRARARKTIVIRVAIL